MAGGPSDDGEDAHAAHEVPVDDVLDLHAFRPQDVASVTEEFVSAAREAGRREIRLIHGRGIGVQRATVHRVLREHPAVQSFWDAPESHLGATVVRLRSREGKGWKRSG